MGNRHVTESTIRQIDNQELYEHCFSQYIDVIDHIFHSYHNISYYNLCQSSLIVNRIPYTDLLGNVIRLSKKDTEEFFDVLNDYWRSMRALQLGWFEIQISLISETNFLLKNWDIRDHKIESYQFYKDQVYVDPEDLAILYY